MTKLDTLLRYTDLILYKTYADLRAETERTYLGFFMVLPDLRFVVENILLALFFMSGVMIRGDIVPEAYQQ